MNLAVKLFVVVFTCVVTIGDAVAIVSARTKSSGTGKRRFTT
jgi:hypothetical protein